MELKIKEITFPEVIEFNFDELKEEIESRVSMYANLVYTDEQIKDAKADRANLNKFVKALSDERIKMKKQCLKPYEGFEAKVNELSKIVQEPIALIDKQVREYEEQQKKAKLEKIKEYYSGIENPDLRWLELSAIYNEKWLNASVSMKSIQEEIHSRLDQVGNDIKTLSELPEFGFEATEVYKTTLDINKALNEGRRLSEIQRRKAEHEAEQERLKAEAKRQEEVYAQATTPIGRAIESIERQAFEAAVNPPVEETEKKQWVSFSALLSVADAQALAGFFAERKITYKPIKGEE